MRKPPKEVVLAVVVFEVVSAILAFRDLASRDDAGVRGPKRLWRVLIGINPGNSLAYWFVGRRN